MVLTSALSFSVVVSTVSLTVVVWVALLTSSFSKLPPLVLSMPTVILLPSL
ncbi:hypothetical protein D3C84_1071830 [compost metagenome]